MGEFIVIKKYKAIDYVERKPENFIENKKYPLVIYLHGAGGRGRNIETIYSHPFFDETKEWLAEAVSVAPQCYEDSWFSIFEQLQDFIQYMISCEYIDETRVYLVGASMGGYATWQMAMSRPEWFAAVVPICGGGMYWNGGRLVNMGVWAFHGALDKIVYLQESEKMVEAIRKSGGNVKFTVYDHCEHNAWTPTFQNREVWMWLLSQKNNYKEMEQICKGVKNFG